MASCCEEDVMKSGQVISFFCFSRPSWMPKGEGLRCDPLIHCLKKFPSTEKPETSACCLLNTFSWMNLHMCTLTNFKNIYSTWHIYVHIFVYIQQLSRVKEARQFWMESQLFLASPGLWANQLSSQSSPWCPPPLAHLGGPCLHRTICSYYSTEIINFFFYVLI